MSSRQLDIVEEELLAVIERQGRSVLSQAIATGSISFARMFVEVAIKTGLLQPGPKWEEESND